MRTQVLKSKVLKPKALNAGKLMVAALVLTAASAADAAPNIPSSELPGRARQQFQESPVDRFTQPSQKTAPLWQWECDRPKAKGKSKGRQQSRQC